MKFVLKINGSWSHARDPNHCIFKANCKQITINFWQSTQSFTVCGKKEKEIKKKLKTLASSYEKSLLRNDTTSKERYSTVTSPLVNRTLQGSYNTPEGSFNTRETPPFQSDIESPTRQMNYADAFEHNFDSRLRPIRTKLDRIWSLIQSLSTRFEENHKLFDELLQAGKNKKNFLYKTTEEKNIIINDLNERLRISERFMAPKEPDSQDNVQQLNWEKPKRPVNNFFPPTWETPTSNRYNKLHSDEKNTIVNNNPTNDPFEIQLANVKLKRKIQYLQKIVEGSQPPSGNTSGHDSQKTPAIALKRSDTSRPASHEALSNAHMKNNRQNQRTSRKEEGSSKYVVGDSMINGMDERKMSNHRRIIKVRAHPGASISDMLDYLRPILRKKPTHLVLHAEPMIFVIYHPKKFSISSIK